MAAEDDIDSTMANRKTSNGDTLAGMVEALENLASPFYLGTDADPDDSDMDVYP